MSQSRKVMPDENKAAEEFALGWVKTYFSKEHLESIPDNPRFVNRAYLIFGRIVSKRLPRYKRFKRLQSTEEQRLFGTRNEYAEIL